MSQRWTNLTSFDLTTDTFEKTDAQRMGYNTPNHFETVRLLTKEESDLFERLKNEGADLLQALEDLYVETTDLERNKKVMERPFIIHVRKLLGKL